MAATNVQAFSGDVEVASNLAVDTNVLFVDSVNNKVGVGTDNPVQSLHVSKVVAGGVNSILVSNPDGTANSSAALKLGVSSEDNDVAKFGIIHERKTTYGRGDTYFCTNYAADTTEVSESDVAMTLLGSNKYVGIGTNNPGTKLHLLNVESSPRLRFERLQSAFPNYTASGTEIGGLQFGADDLSWATQHMSSEIVGIHHNPNYSGAQGILAFKTSSAQGSNPTEKMRIRYDGAVGIGTNSPYTILTLNKTFPQPSHNTEPASDTFAGITFPSNLTSFAAGGIAWSTSTTIAAAKIWYQPVSYSNYSNQAGIHGILCFGTGYTGTQSDSSDMCINSEGRVGIGTTNARTRFMVNNTLVARNNANTGHGGVPITYTFPVDGMYILTFCYIGFYDANITRTYLVNKTSFNGPYYSTLAGSSSYIQISTTQSSVTFTIVNLPSNYNDFGLYVHFLGGDGY